MRPRQPHSPASLEGGANGSDRGLQRGANTASHASLMSLGVEEDDTLLLDSHVRSQSSRNTPALSLLREGYGICRSLTVERRCEFEQQQDSRTLCDLSLSGHIHSMVKGLQWTCVTVHLSRLRPLQFG